MQYIQSFKDKKLISYLKSGMCVRIDYPHGLGDLLMFLPYFHELQKKYPGVIFHLKTTPDKQNLIGHLPEPCDYDYVFKLSAYFNEGGGEYAGMTKPECNCKLDLGIAYDPNLEYKDVANISERSISSLQGTGIEVGKKGITKEPTHNPAFVGFSFFSTHFPAEIDCREGLGRYLWQRTIEEGYVPIELQFYQSGNRHNLIDRKFGFVDCTTRACQPDVSRLISIVKSCRGIASVITGTYHLGMVLMPQTTLCLSKEFGPEYFSHKQTGLNIDVRKRTEDCLSVIDRWFDSMRQVGL